MQMRWRFGCLAVSGVLTLLGCAFEPTAPRGLPNFVGSLFNADAALWFVTDTLGGGLARPTVDADRVYFGRGDLKSRGEIIARDRATGALRWNQPFTTARNAVLAGNNVAVAWGVVELFDRRSGAVVQRYAPANDVTQGNLATDAERVYVGTYYGQLAAIDGSTGKEIWRTPLATNTGTGAQGVAALAGRVAVTLDYSAPIGTLPADSGIVAVVDAATGHMLWRVSTASTANRSAAFSDPPIIAGNLVIAVTQSHRVDAYDLTLGTHVWSYDGGRGAFDYASNGIAECDGAVIISDGNMGLVSLDQRNGTARWRLPDLQIGSLFSIDCSYGTVMALSDGILKIFDAQTGHLLYRVPKSDGSDIFVANAVRGANALYVATDRGFGAFSLP